MQNQINSINAISIVSHKSLLIITYSGVKIGQKSSADCMVLLEKDGHSAVSPFAYQPICLPDDAGKLLERIVAARLVEYLKSRSGGSRSGR